MAQAARAVSERHGLRRRTTASASRSPPTSTDDGAQAAAQTVASQRGWSTSNIRKGGLPAALRLLGVAPPARFMIVDIEGLPIEEVEQGLTELTRLGSQVMALGTVNDVNYFRRIMRTGARDYLIKPIDADELGAIFVRLEQPGDGVSPKGRVVGMIGARGGVGVTTLAINAAFIMAEKLSRRTALVDMDIYAGNIALALDIEPTRGLREALDDPERVDETFLQNAMAKFGKSLHVLATEEAFDDTVRLTDDKVLMLADTIRANFDMAIMDLPRHFVMREPALFSRFDDIVIVSELTLQSLRDVNRLLKLMAVRNRQAKIHVIANQVDREARRDAQGVRGRDGGEGPLRLPARPEGDDQVDAQGPAARRLRPEAQAWSPTCTSSASSSPACPRRSRRASPGAEQGSSPPWKTGSTPAG